MESISFEFRQEREMMLSQARRLESQLHELLFNVQLLLFPGADTIEPFYQTVPGQLDQQSDGIQLCEHSFYFTFSTLANMEKNRCSFRSRVKKIDSFLGWTTHISPRFQEDIGYFDPCENSQQSMILEELNEQIHQLGKQLCENDPSGFHQIFGIFDYQLEEPLLFLFDMRVECPNFSVYLLKQSCFLDRGLLYSFFLNDLATKLNDLCLC